MCWKIIWWKKKQCRIITVPALGVRVSLSSQEYSRPHSPLTLKKRVQWLFLLPRLRFFDFSIVPNLPQAQCDMNSGGNSRQNLLSDSVAEKTDSDPYVIMPPKSHWADHQPAHCLSRTIKCNHHTSVGIQIQKGTVPSTSLCLNSSRWLLTPPIAGVWTSEVFFFFSSHEWM